MRLRYVRPLQIGFVYALFVSMMLSLFFPHVAFADTPYGEGVYGGGNYGGAESSSGNNNSNDQSGASPPSCNSTPPTSSPDLFQIDAKDTTARLYFSPAGSSISSYYLSFGQGNLDEGFGAPLAIDSRGVASYDVTFLKPNTTYTFKIRGANGCASGPWSSSMRVKTTNSTKSTIKYYPLTQAKTSVVGTLAGLPGYIKTKVTTSVPIASNKTQLQVHVASPKTQEAKSASKPAASPSIFQRILNFFGF